MNLLLIIVFMMVIFIYGGLNYYIGQKGLYFVTELGFNLPKIAYWLLVWITAFAFFIARAGDRWLPNWLSHFLEVIGAYWLGIMTYLIMIMLLGDLLMFIHNRRQFIPVNLISHPKFTVITGFAVIGLTLVIVAHGWWNARNPQILRYEVQLNKEVEELDELNIVMLSDLHLGKLVNRRQLEGIIREINFLSPDLVAMPGDIIDDRIDAFVNQNMMKVFQRLNPPLGIYASMGNHEYIGGQVEMVEKYLKEAGITVLRDESVKIADAFYLVGREDRAYERFKGSPRKSIDELLQDVDKELPIILLDHQPVDIDRADAAGVDIQFSGHTHRGQLFPFRIFTKKIYEVDWGYEKFNNTHVIVTSGAGTWGPPLRVGHPSEIIYIKVKFQ